MRNRLGLENQNWCMVVNGADVSDNRHFVLLTVEESVVLHAQQWWEELTVHPR